MISQLTFRRIENLKDIAGKDEISRSSLSEWYQSVRDKPLGQFSDKDFGIACRQQLYTEFVVPALLSRLESEPLAGDMYDGELLMALSALPKTFWEHCFGAKHALRTMLESNDLETDDTDVCSAIDKLRSVAITPQTEKGQA
jgi:hypothetical protein